MVAHQKVSADHSFCGLHFGDRWLYLHLQGESWYSKARQAKAGIKPVSLMQKNLQ